jgi:hypothetical protein
LNQKIKKIRTRSSNSAGLSKNMWRHTESLMYLLSCLNLPKEMAKLRNRPVIESLGRIRSTKIEILCESLKITCWVIESLLYNSKRQMMVIRLLISRNRLSVLSEVTLLKTMKSGNSLITAILVQDISSKNISGL